MWPNNCSFCTNGMCNSCCSKQLIRITPIDPSTLNSLTTTAKSTSTVPGVAAATISQAWSIATLTNDLGQPPMTAIGDVIIVLVGTQGWAIVRFFTTVATAVPVTGIIQALSYSNYFQTQIQVA